MIHSRGRNDLRLRSSNHGVRLQLYFTANYHYRYSQVQAEIDVINASWNVGGTSNGLADSVGIMVYEGTEALR